LRASAVLQASRGCQDEVWRAEAVMAEVLEREGRVDEAISEWERIFGEGGATRLVVDRLSLNYERAGRYEEAFRLLMEGLTRIRWTDLQVVSRLARRRDR